MYNNKRSAAQKWKHGLIAAALTVSLIAALPIWTVGKAQAAPNLDTECRLAIRRADEEPQGEVVVDLYKVADAEVLTGYDAYTLKLADAYLEFEGRLDEAMNQEQSKTAGANELYRALAQDLAKEVLKAGTGGGEEQIQVQPAKTIELSSAATSGLDAGMYLVIAHGRGLTAAQYTTYVTEEESGETNLATVAFSDEYVYTYLPELIALPMKSMSDTGDAPEGIFRTDGEGEWMYDVAVTLKSEKSLALAGLTINKTFEIPGGTVIAPTEGCVYQIEAQWNGKTVYSNVVALHYPDTSVSLEKIIPVGASITVTEVYDGAAFEIAGAKEAVVDAAAKDNGNDIVNEVSFTNRANGNSTSGDIVTNSFEKDTDEGWTWNNPKSGAASQ